MRRILVILLVLSLNMAYASDQKNIPVTKVVLYKNGVGYFERSEKIQGDREIVLTFREEDMKDILKSLIVLDLNGGKITQVEYDSIKPLNKLLEGFSINLEGDANLISLLLQIRGSDMVINIGPENVKGKLVGLRTKRIMKDDVLIEQQIVDLISDEGNMKSVEMSDVKSIELLDKELQSEIQEYLDVLFQYRKKDMKRVSITCSGKGKREIVLGYIIEAPVWKTSYRLVVEKGKKPYFQGWAIVDNIQDENWENVSLSLVSGLPVSFIQDLYTPYFKRRQVVEIDREDTIELYETELAVGEGDYSYDAAQSLGSGVAMAMKSAPEPRRAYKKEMISSQQIQTVSQEAGDMFEYRIDHPVSIDKNRSATIPIAAGEIEGERISLFNESQRKNNPYSAVWMKNTTGLTLEGGPVMVLEESIYAGESLMDTLKPDQKSIIPYAIDLGIVVDTSRKSENKSVYRIVIERGTMYARYMRQDIKTYTITNKTDDNKKLVIEHPFRNDWRLVKPEKAYEETAGYYRFVVDLLPKKKDELTVVEERSYYESFLLRNISQEDIEIFVSKNYLTPEIKKVFSQIVSTKAEIEVLKKQINEKQSRINDIFKDQGRIRDNLKALRDTAAERKLAENYVAKLGDQEKEVAQLEKEIRMLREKKNAKQQELDEILSELKFSKEI